MHLKVPDASLYTTDISKAFDCLPHNSIYEVLRGQGIREIIIKLFENMYSGATTTFKNCGGFKVTLKRGVKQGDPLSPFLFNLGIDPLLREPEDFHGGFELFGHRISFLAFADDLVLLCKSNEALQCALNIVQRHLSRIDLSLSAEKCGTFGVKKKGKSWVPVKTDVQINGSCIRNYEPDEKFKYLGINFSVCNGISYTYLLQDICLAMDRCNRLALKPRQKRDLLCKYILPGYYHLLVAGTPSLNFLDDLDREIRKRVKDMFHLPHFASNGLLYAGHRDGGLGVPKLSNLIRASIVKAATVHSEIDDLVFQRLMENKMEKEVRSIMDTMSLRWPTNEKSIIKWKIDSKKNFLLEWSAQMVQGLGIECFKNNPIGNCWLVHKELEAGEEIDLLKMRSNVFPTRCTIARVDKEASRICRRCKEEDETLGHIIGECTAGSGCRLFRHDSLVSKIEQRAIDNGWIVAKEQWFETEDHPLKPDLVIKTPGGAWVVDVSLRFESADSLKRAKEEKEAKYSRIFRNVKETMKVEKISVLPIILGDRGGFPNFTRKNLELLGISSTIELKGIMLEILKTSISIVRAHMDFG